MHLQLPETVDALCFQGELRHGQIESPQFTGCKWGTWDLAVTPSRRKNSNSSTVSTYQYGSYGISPYALRSQTIDLEPWVNQQVRVVGTPIEGYPLSGGPEYLEVVSIEANP